MTKRIKDFRVTVRLRNNQLIERREQLGLSPRAFAAAVGIAYQLYLDYEGLRLAPFARGTGELRPSAQKIVDYHGVGADELWPAAVLAVERAAGEGCFDAADLGRMGVGERTCTLPGPDEVLARREQRVTVDLALEMLPERQRSVLQRLYGFTPPPDASPEADWTLEMVGAAEDIGRERVRQIAEKGLRRLSEGKPLSLLARHAAGIPRREHCYTFFCTNCGQSLSVHAATPQGAWDAIRNTHRWSRLGPRPSLWSDLPRRGLCCACSDQGRLRAYSREFDRVEEQA